MKSLRESEGLLLFMVLANKPYSQNESRVKADRAGSTRFAPGRFDTARSLERSGFKHYALKVVGQIRSAA